MTFEESQISYNESWALLDQVIYGVCRDLPGHSIACETYAKVLLIGRAFASGVGRHVKSAGTQGSSITQMCEHLTIHHIEIDEIIDRLKKIKEPLDAEKLSAIVDGHGRFCELISRIARSSLVSFASKYLHFHSPVVPIFDSWVRNQAWSMRQKENLVRFECPSNGYDNFYRYCLCFLQRYEKLAVMGANVRSAEYYLMCLASGADDEISNSPD